MVAPETLAGRALLDKHHFKIDRRGARQSLLESTLDSVFVWKEPTMVQPSDGGSRVRADAIIGWLRGYGDTRVNSFLIDERRSIPAYIVLDFGNHGVLGLQAPTEAGGASLTNRDALRVLIQLAAIDTTLCSFVGVHNALGLRPVLRYGTEVMRNSVLPQLASGRELASFAFTEPGAGSNPRAISATATPALADEFSVEDILAIEHDFIPLDGADVFKRDRFHWRPGRTG
jgi:Acyl-CoA dehydrogenase, N-terminal domain